ncbi:V-type ATP synthase subunit E [Blautia wexlerae]|uniref:Archaeal/vacuolar-type H+-ATPase subunit E n=1 Tax=Blautia wexlerae TaxID=418240 RepID=A0ABX2GMH0_9FIRM|nr:V-type ATP synthase subunit E [Blautia wexlerae]MDD7418591.1 V-type ATP synthase subunit E [Ruminococcus sp.]NSF73424.1 Archaeal/vacuolar-type H+-ATPase subunit E [Blautia wexlerae]
MTIDEKLSHFYDVTIEDAQAKAAGILEEHRKALAQMTEKHKADSQENAQVQIKAETANARREINKALSAEQLTIKRDWTKKQNELKEKLFAEVKTQLENFRNTPDYPAYLESKIKEALDFAEQDKINIYISPEDSALLPDLVERTKAFITVSAEDFLGGIKATIPHKNILIDHSFAGNFQAVYKEFKFDGGPKHE